jgi:hypothetical protein
VVFKILGHRLSSEIGGMIYSVNSSRLELDSASRRPALRLSGREPLFPAQVAEFSYTRGR